MNLQQILAIPKEELDKASKVKVNILPEVESLYQHFARSIADEIKQHNARGEPVRIILPVGPTPQYRILTEVSNREKISWKNVYTFNMDEYLDWQGRPVSLNHPMSFEGFMRKKFFDLLDEEAIIKAAKETGALVTAENHSIIGGLGSAVSEVLTDNFPVPLQRVGIRDSFGCSGKIDDLFRKYELTPVDIAKAARKALERKRQ